MCFYLYCCFRFVRPKSRELPSFGTFISFLTALNDSIVHEITSFFFFFVKKDRELNDKKPIFTKKYAFQSIRLGKIRTVLECENVSVKRIQMAYAQLGGRARKDLATRPENERRPRTITRANRLKRVTSPSVLRAYRAVRIASRGRAGSIALYTTRTGIRLGQVRRFW